MAKRRKFTFGRAFAKFTRGFMAYGLPVVQYAALPTLIALALQTEPAPT
jgi:hypothetical protein